MNWNDLKIFLAIAAAGSLSGAAKRLQYNHSTVFRRLNVLEQQLGVRLFERLPGGYSLTLPGQQMLHSAQEAQTTIERLELELAGQDYALEGKVRITTALNIARTLLPPIIKRLRQSHPGIEVELSAGDSDYDLNRREADIALRATQQPPAHLIGKRLVTYSWWIHGPSVGNSSEAVRASPKTLEDLHGQPLIGADPAMLRLDAFQWLEAHYHGDIVTRANDLSTMAALAIAGVGYALLPSDQNEPGLQRFCQVPHLTSELWLLTHPDLRNVQRIKVVWEALSQSSFTTVVHNCR